jgi:hypothetical protein
MFWILDGIRVRRHRRNLRPQSPRARGLKNSATCGVSETGRPLPSWIGGVNVSFWPTAAYRRLAVYVCLGFLCGRSAVCPGTAGNDPERSISGSLWRVSGLFPPSPGQRSRDRQPPTRSRHLTSKEAVARPNTTGRVCCRSVQIDTAAALRINAIPGLATPQCHGGPKIPSNKGANLEAPVKLR